MQITHCCSQIVPKIITPSLGELFQFILDALTDAAYVNHRLSILQVLSQLARNTGYVVEPYKAFPTLMPTLFDLFKNDKNQDICLEVRHVIFIV